VYKRRSGNIWDDRIWKKGTNYAAELPRTHTTPHPSFKKLLSVSHKRLSSVADLNRAYEDVVRKDASNHGFPQLSAPDTGDFRTIPHCQILKSALVKHCLERCDQQ
jgi:hypothetical protein